MEWVVGGDAAAGSRVLSLALHTFCKVCLHTLQAQPAPTAPSAADLRPLPGAPRRTAHVAERAATLLVAHNGVALAARIADVFAAPTTAGEDAGAGQGDGDAGSNAQPVVDLNALQALLLRCVQELSRVCEGAWASDDAGALAAAVLADVRATVSTLPEGVAAVVVPVCDRLLPELP